MPRTTVDVACELQHLSILDPDGNVDDALEPEVDPELLQRLYRCMWLARHFDERMLSLQRQGRLGTFAPIGGQEASQLGAIAVLRGDDWMVPSYRDVAALIWRGAPLDGLLLYNAGYNEGGAVDDDRNDLPIAIPVGSQMLHAVGLAHGLALQGSDQVSMTFFGDGATSEGDFHEALNFAGVFGAPTVFVCENNGYAISVPRERQTASKTLAQKAFAYGLPALQVDGNDILAVYAGCLEAVERARDEHVPTLIECLTYRMSVHTTVDDPAKYRDESEVEAWKSRDPLVRFRTYLGNRGLLDSDGQAEIEADTETQIEDAVQAWQQAMAQLDEPQAMFDHVYAEEPRAQRQQRSSLEAGSDA